MFRVFGYKWPSIHNITFSLHYGADVIIASMQKKKEKITVPIRTLSECVTHEPQYNCCGNRDRFNDRFRVTLPVQAILHVIVSAFGAEMYNLNLLLRPMTSLFRMFVPQICSHGTRNFRNPMCLGKQCYIDILTYKIHALINTSNKIRPGVDFLCH